MRILQKLLTAVFLYFFIFTAPSTAHIVSLNLRSNNRQIIPISDFEFTNVGYVSFVLSSITVTSTSSRAANESRIGFFLQSHDDDFYLYTREARNQDIFEFKQNTSTCPFDFKSNSSVLFTFQNLSHGPQFSFNKSFPITYSGINSLFFINCNNESVVTLEGQAELYNLDDGNSTNKNFLLLGKI
ncbi:unnamed protein product [Lactuca virosa]|uniref:CAND6/7 N-terminal domain-containing protein n=1 Tax=Lactuca virosa TaxID=75947 RepID=A0AAU9LMI7_9ASTR|nr:unnamed protein product [Lactuca virosa]